MCEGSHCSSHLSLKKKCGSNVVLCVGKGSVPVSCVTGMWSYKRNLCRCSELGTCKVPFHWPFQTGKLIISPLFSFCAFFLLSCQGHPSHREWFGHLTSSVRFPGKGQTSQYQNSEVAREQWQRMSERVAKVGFVAIKVQGGVEMCCFSHSFWSYQKWKKKKS